MHPDLVSDSFIYPYKKGADIGIFVGMQNLDDSCHIMKFTSSFFLILGCANKNHPIDFVFVMHDWHMYFKCGFFWCSLDLCYISLIYFALILKLSISVS